jgi:hypothetical protein
MLQVAVPPIPAGETRWEPAVEAFVQIFNASSIYRMTPVDEAIAMKALLAHRTVPHRYIDRENPVPLLEAEDGFFEEDLDQL